MTADPLADLIAEAHWGRTYDRQDVRGIGAQAAAAAVREWIVEQIDHERRDWGIRGSGPGWIDDEVNVALTALDLLQDRIEEGAP